MTLPVISVVSTLYTSSAFLDRFVPETVAAVEQMEREGFEPIPGRMIARTGLAQFPLPNCIIKDLVR